MLDYDPLVDKIIMHDEYYDQAQTDEMFAALEILENGGHEIAEKIHQVVDFEDPSQKSAVVTILKKFVHSLGFEMLNFEVTKFMWDQFVMKIRREKIEIFLCFAIMLVCMKEKILLVSNWQEIVDILLHNREGKLITLQDFKPIYVEVFSNFDYYISSYKFDKNGELVDMDFEDEGKKDEQQVEDEYIGITGKKRSRKGGMDSKQKQLIRKNLTVVQPRNPEQMGMVPFIKADKYDEDILDGFEDSDMDDDPDSDGDDNNPYDDDDGYGEE